MAASPGILQQQQQGVRGEALPAWALSAAAGGALAAAAAAAGLDVAALDERRGAQIRGEWSESATDVVIDVWGEKHVAIGRGKLKKHEWDEVAEKVSQRLGGGKNGKTWLQCKNKIDSVKKKYKIVLNQKAAGTAKKEWRLFDRVHELVGGAGGVDGRGGLDDSDGADDDEDGEDGEDSLFRQPPQAPVALPVQDNSRRGAPPVQSGGASSAQAKPVLKKRKEGPHGYHELALAIKEFGARYERVEMARQEKAVELERMRMTFVKELEVQRMQVQLEIAKLTGGRHLPSEPPLGASSLMQPRPPDGFSG